MKILLYGNGSSGNHGCEAIVRGTVKTLNDINNTFIVASENKKDDEQKKHNFTYKTKDSKYKKTNTGREIRL